MGTLRCSKAVTCMNVPVGHVAHEEDSNGGEEKLGQPYGDEHGVAAAEVEPVATQQANPKAGMGLMQENSRFSST